ncbi:GNAT family N-acetyltransferase [Ferrimonas balearica]|uniref:GNAT family N-acetyltransferase n=1 Tax=Ferrimonas balearica TaxID=44012 RepID=UPI001C997AF9|nr:GNAT family N-acetyltransferase [Ferrimonas balearica]MBY5991151.1 GNAT family N-acetyltransferase [Ferrimonas balearica]
MLHFQQADPHTLPMALLLEADPDPLQVAHYLEGSWGFAAENEGDVVGVCVVTPLGEGRAELMNIAVAPQCQGQGVGSELLAYVIEQVRARGLATLELGTGTFGHQLAFYQRAGFRVTAVVANHFLDHYPEPIFENGIQHKDMLRLTLALN